MSWFFVALLASAPLAADGERPRPATVGELARRLLDEPGPDDLVILRDLEGDHPDPVFAERLRAAVTAVAPPARVRGVVPDYVHNTFGVEVENVGTREIRRIEIGAWVTPADATRSLSGLKCEERSGRLGGWVTVGVGVTASIVNPQWRNYEHEIQPTTTITAEIIWIQFADGGWWLSPRALTLPAHCWKPY